MRAPPNYLSFEGATSLATRIVEFWHARGFVVTASVQKVTQREGLQFIPTWGVATDMKNGWPTKRRAA